MGTRSTIQRREKGQADHRSADIHAVAEHGVAGAGGTLPYAAAIQHSFGHHDIAGIAAHTGGAAREANAAMGSLGYASGNRIAFGTAPSLHTAAHEAAHVVQQRAGVQLKGGVGEAGDRYERHADSVAELVVQGKSAESLLDTMAGGSGSRAIQQRRAGPHTVQHRGHAVQFNGQSAGYSTVDGTSDVAPAPTPSPQTSPASPGRDQALSRALQQCDAMSARARGLTDSAGETLRRLQALDEPRLVTIAAWLSGAGRPRVIGPIEQAMDKATEANILAGRARNQVRANDISGARANIDRSATLIGEGYGLINTATDRAIGNAGRWVTGLEVTKTAAFAAFDALAQANGLDPASAGAISGGLEAAATWSGEMLSQEGSPSANDIVGGVLRVGMAGTMGAVTGAVSGGTADSSLSTRVIANGTAGAFAGANNNLASQATSGGNVSGEGLARAAVGGALGGAVGGALGGNTGAISTRAEAAAAIADGMPPEIVNEVLNRSIAGAALSGTVSRGTEAAVGVGYSVHDEVRRGQ